MIKNNNQIINYYTLENEELVSVEKNPFSALNTLEKIKKAVVESMLTSYKEEVKQIYSRVDSKLGWWGRKLQGIKKFLKMEMLFGESYVSKVDRFYQEIIGLSDSTVSGKKTHCDLKPFLDLKKLFNRINNETDQKKRMEILEKGLKDFQNSFLYEQEQIKELRSHLDRKFVLNIEKSEDIIELALLWRELRHSTLDSLPPFNINTTQDDKTKLQVLLTVLDDSQNMSNSYYMKEIVAWTKAISISDEKVMFEIALQTAKKYPQEFSNFLSPHFNITNEENLIDLANCCLSNWNENDGNIYVSNTSIVYFFLFQLDHFAFQKEQVRFDLLMLGIKKCDKNNSHRMIEFAAKSGLNEQLSSQLLKSAFVKNSKAAIDCLRFFNLSEEDKKTYFEIAIKQCKFPIYMDEFVAYMKEDKNWTSKNFNLIDLQFFFDTGFHKSHDEKDVKEWFWLFETITNLKNQQLRRGLIYLLAHHNLQGLLRNQEIKDKFTYFCDKKEGKVAIPSLLISSWNYSMEELSKLSKFKSLFECSLLKDKVKLLELTAALETLRSQLQLLAGNSVDFNLKHLDSIYPGPYKNQDLTSTDFEAIIREIMALTDLKSVPLQEQGKEAKDYYINQLQNKYSDQLKIDNFNIENIKKTFANRFGFDTIRQLFSFRKELQQSKDVNEKIPILLDQLIKAHSEGNGDYRYQEESLGKHAKKVFSQREDLFKEWKKGACFEIKELLKGSNDEAKDKGIEIDDLKKVIEKTEINWEFLESFFNNPDNAIEIRKKLGEKRKEVKEDQNIKDLLTLQDSLIRLLSIEDNIIQKRGKELTKEQISDLIKQEKIRLTNEAIKNLEKMKTSEVATELIAILNAIRTPHKAKSSSFEGYTVVDTDSPELLFHSGEHVQGSCLTFADNTEYTQILVGLMADPKIRMISVLDKSGKIVARAMLKILWDDENQRPVLLKEKTYKNPCRPELLEALEQAFIERARAMGLPYVRKFEVGDNPVDFDILSLDGGLSPIEEVSLLESKKSPLYTIPRSLLGMVYDPEEKL